MGSYLSSIIKQFEYCKSLGNRTFDQLKDEDINWQQNPESNSISIISKHITGNLRSRWTNFLTEDGEKSWRNRDNEFIASYSNKHQMIKAWDDAWSILFDVLKNLKDSDLEKEIYIRNQGHTVVEAINRQLAHYSYHVGQLVQLGKMIKGPNWQSLSIPKGQSETYNKGKFNQDKGRRHFTEDL
ncbi:MAG: DUF1572 domain-containing protein [Bacteroidia bacterium]|nr:DUF1572 domain-containing protein [Bacteroidia bacterium]